MVNTFNTEPDPEPDLEPDIRGYSQSNNQVNRGITSTTQPEPLSFVNSEPVPLAPVATRDAAINEKDYAAPGTASTGHGTMETTLNPSPSGQDTTSIYSSHHPDDEDQEPAFPFISWKTSAIVRTFVSWLSIANDRTRSKDAQLSVPPRYYCRLPGLSPIQASPMWSYSLPVC
jgi:hypothetical protein